MSTMGNAADLALASLIHGREVIECNRYTLDGHTLLVATVVGDPDSDGEEYYADETAVAWDVELGRNGELNACWIDNAELSTWLSLRWPAYEESPGFLRDGSWTGPAKELIEVRS